MVLVDTSVWIRYFSNRLDRADVLDALLSSGDVLAHPFVYGELFIGDLGGRARFLSVYRSFRQSSLLSHDEVVGFASVRRLNGRGIGWIDAHLLGSTLVDRALLWTKDPRLEAVAEGLHIAYKT